MAILKKVLPRKAFPQKGVKNITSLLVALFLSAPAPAGIAALFAPCRLILGEEGRGEAGGGTGDGECDDGGPRDDREEPLGWRRRLLQIKL